MAQIETAENLPGVDPTTHQCTGRDLIWYGGIEFKGLLLPGQELPIPNTEFTADGYTILPTQPDRVRSAKVLADFLTDYSHRKPTELTIVRMIGRWAIPAGDGSKTLYRASFDEKHPRTEPLLSTLVIERDTDGTWKTGAKTEITKERAEVAVASLRTLARIHSESVLHGTVASMTAITARLAAEENERRLTETHTTPRRRFWPGR